MQRKIFTFLALICFSHGLLAQDDAKTDAGYRMGVTNYSAKPKNAWELGLHLGHYFIDGDVDRNIPAGYGLGLHLRKAVHYAFSVRADLFYGQAKGLDPQTWRHRTVGNGIIGGGLVEPEYAPYAGNADGWFPSHKTRRIYGALQGIINIGNILFHQKNNKWNWYLGVGAGLSNHVAKLDLLDANNQPYQNVLTKAGWTFEKFDTKAGRKEIKDAIRNNIYDGTYETEGPKKAGIFRLGDETNIHVMFTGSVGVSRKISKRFNIGLEHQVMATDNDYLDGIRFRTSDDITQDVDIEHYTNLRLAFNLGNLDKVTEPLYWVNPLDATLNDIAELKARPVLDLTDSDSDGIIDMLDQEKDTPAGAAVDTRGIALDSDNDGIADYQDKEPYSPIGYPIGKDGVANVKKCESCLTEADVFRMIDSRSANFKSASSDCGKWFLPMIHFDLDKYRLKPEFYSQLHHVATVMKQCPSMCVSVIGHTDVRNSNSYNNLLSYNRAQAVIDYLTSNYGIERSRLKLMYGGEDTPMVGKSTKEVEHYMNRRVEFRVCEPTDADMERPQGGSAGSGSTSKSGESGSSFRGNKNSGY
jgi:outer membrane protein OmpA-like peptidoglycan-associated protein